MSLWNSKTVQTTVYRGIVDASGAAYPADPAVGDWYAISKDGTISGVAYVVGDQIVWNGSTWDKIPTGAIVTAVAGKVGDVTLEYGDLTDYTSLVRENANDIPEWDKAPWEDCRPSAVSVRSTGPNVPGLVAVQGGVLLHSFSATQMNEIFMTFQLPHAWKLGSNLHPHLHVVYGAAGTGNVLWKVEYTIGATDEDYAALTTTILKLIASPNADRKCQLVELPDIDMSLFDAVSDVSIRINCRIYRDAADVADTFAGAVFLEDADIHVQVNTPGSEAEYSK